MLTKGAVVLSRIDSIIYQVRSSEEVADEEYFMAIENKLKEMELSEGSLEIVKEDKGLHVKFLCEISNNQELMLELMINERTGAKRYKVISCYVKSKIGDLSYEEELPDMWGE